MAKEYIEKWSVVNKLTDIENKCQKFKPFNETEREMYRMICKTEISIGKAPAADVVEVKHGCWVGTADGYADGELVYDMWECSECGYDADGADEKPNWNFCPNCGAKMDVKENDNAQTD